MEQTEAYIDSITDKKVKRRQIQPKPFRDVRIFVNTFNKAIQAMKDSGIDALSNKTETDEYIEFMVRIPKDASASPKSA